MASVAINHLRKSFGQTDVLQDVCVDVADGEFVALVGPSGCGKSTLLRSIAGLERVSGGEIRIDGEDVTDLAPRDRDIAMVFQNYALYPHMTVRENMGFSMKLRREPLAKIEREVMRAADILGLDELLDRKPRQLSGGQRQRVAMGRAIVRNPKVFLFDEPLSNLDAQLRVQMRTEIRKLQRTLNATVIYVTHDQIEAMTMADRIVVMRGGVVEQQGAPLDLFDEPKTSFVAGFIGSPSMNLLPGRLLTEGFTTYGGAKLPVPPGVTPKEDALYGIRPEALSLTSDDSGIAAQVVLVEPLGSETLLVVDFGGAEAQILLRFRAKVKPGERVRVIADLNAIHIFDAQNGRRLNPMRSEQQ
ncbi:sn-glycerol-3-phosphate ABC transporter ATP-binding protein UgpC [Neorhizobium sp. NCHU2750]|uniref:ABC transporter ATP-binding protein n=1 Tax=Neorhizobium sp. NCHU2750 TaxID=1825976 RepID=UPI000E7735B1|nr:sugar ABC transporter ATP-binding protein [Neorhizobium sp. NCHU2750]